MMAFPASSTPQVSFYVPDMTCPRSVGAVTRAVKSVDHGATVKVDLHTREVQIAAGKAEPPQLRLAICNAGYSPVRRWPPLETAWTVGAPARLRPSYFPGPEF